MSMNLSDGLADDLMTRRMRLEGTDRPTGQIGAGQVENRKAPKNLPRQGLGWTGHRIGRGKAESAGPSVYLGLSRGWGGS